MLAIPVLFASLNKKITDSKSKISSTYSPNKLGIHNEIPSKKVTKNKTKIIAIKKGTNGLMTFETEIFATPAPTKRMVPTGGVHKPIQRFNTMIIPKWTGSIPKVETTGKKMGVKIKTAGVISIKVPTTNSVILINKKIRNGLLTVSNKKPVINWGMLSKENNHDMVIDVQIKNMTIAVVLALFNNIIGRSLKEMVR